MKIKARMNYNLYLDPTDDSPIVTVVEFYNVEYMGVNGEPQKIEMARYYDQSGRFGSTYPHNLRVIDEPADL